MTRVRTDNVFGTITDNPLTNVATTMNSAGLANLAAVSSKEAIIILDPNRVSGAPEIVVVTAHTGAATSATIQRGQFGTSARQHASGTAWVHGPIAGNATTYATAADDQGDVLPVDGWESWTPTFTNFTLSNGTINHALFIRLGRTIFYRLAVTLGSSSSMGTEPAFSLPVERSASYVALQPIGWANLGDTGTADNAGVVFAHSTTTARLKVFGAAATYVTTPAVTATVPFTWGTGDTFSCSGFYEAAT